MTPVYALPSALLLSNGTTKMYDVELRMSFDPHYTLLRLISLFFSRLVAASRRPTGSILAHVCRELLVASLDEHTPLHRRPPTNQLTASLRDVLVRCFLPRHTIRRVTVT